MNRFRNIIDSLPEILRQLPTEPIGLAALTVLVLAFVAYLFVRPTDSARWRFAMLLVVVVSIMIATWRYAVGKDALISQFAGDRFRVPPASEETIAYEPEGAVTYEFQNLGTSQFDVRLMNPEGKGWDAITINPGKKVAVQKTSAHGALVLAAKPTGEAQGTYRRVE